MTTNNNSKQLICACSNCNHKLKYCVARLSCFAAYDTSNYRNSCLGCIDTKIQNLKCDSNSSSLRVSCCDNENFCNLNLTVPQSKVNEADNNISKNLIIFSIIASFLVILTVFTFFIIDRWIKSSKFRSEASWQIKNELKKSIATKKLKYEKEESIGDLSSTSTGVGASELVERTLAKDLHVEYERGPLGRGRFGVVWLAQLHSTRVAVKSLLSVHEPQWSCESRIYSTPMFAHPNLLGFIGADILGVGCQINMLIVTEYHPFGSLYDYLENNILSRDQMLRFLSSSSNGLSHLHSEIRGVSCKPSIAHRDIKTKNILIKRDMECCLADFGSSFRDDDGEVDATGVDYRLVGSVRYMPPEILANERKLWRVVDFKNADVYSFGLVIWEVLSRVRVGDDVIVEDHRPPFFDIIRGDPHISIMKDIVCENKIRPSLSASLRLDTCEKSRQVIDMMKECWNENPNERPSALNLKKKLLKLCSSLFIDY